MGEPRAGRAERLKTAPDLPLREALDAAGVDGSLRAVVDRFYAGVLLEDGGDTSNAFALLLLRMFVLGAPGLPAAGMQALPRQLATGLTVRTHTRVASVVPGADAVEAYADGASVRANTVVVATDPASAGLLTAVKPPAMKGVVTWWYAAPEPPTHLDLLCVDGRARPGGPLVNVAVMTAAAPSYAPAGRRLLQASHCCTRVRIRPLSRRRAGTRLRSSAARRATGRSWPATRSSMRCPPSCRR